MNKTIKSFRYLLADLWHSRIDFCFQMSKLRLLEVQRYPSEMIYVILFGQFLSHVLKYHYHEGFVSATLTAWSTKTKNMLKDWIPTLQFIAAAIISSLFVIDFLPRKIKITYQIWFLLNLLTNLICFSDRLNTALAFFN